MSAAIYLTLSIGIINTIYLTITGIRGKDVYCFLLPDQWCKAVQTSKYSKTFGVSNPILGLGMLIVIGALYYLSTVNILPFYFTYLLIAGGFIFSIYFLWIQAFVIKAFCTWCVLSFLVFAALFVEASMLYW